MDFIVFNILVILSPLTLTILYSHNFILQALGMDAQQLDEWVLWLNIPGTGDQDYLSFSEHSYSCISQLI